MDFDQTVELVCNIGAAELILPRENVRSLITQKGFSLSLLLELCELGPVSGPAALIQLVGCAPNQCYGVVCEHGIPPILANSNQKTFVDQSPKNTLYILYAIWSPSAQYPIARFTRISKDHILFMKLSNQTIIRGKDRIPFRSGKNWQVPCEICVFRNNVYGLFHATPPPNVQQPRLLWSASYFQSDDISTPWPQPLPKPSRTSRWSNTGGILTLTLETVLILNMKDILDEAAKWPFDQENKGEEFAS